MAWRSSAGFRRGICDDGLARNKAYHREGGRVCCPCRLNEAQISFNNYCSTLHEHQGYVFLRWKYHILIAWYIVDARGCCVVPVSVHAAACFVPYVNLVISCRITSQRSHRAPSRLQPSSGIPDLNRCVANRMSIRPVYDSSSYELMSCLFSTGSYEGRSQ